MNTEVITKPAGTVMHSISVNRIAIVWFCFFVVTCVCNNIIAAFINVDWSMITTQGKVLLIVSIIGNVGTVIGAFLWQRLQKVDPADFGDLPATKLIDTSPPKA